MNNRLQIQILATVAFFGIAIAAFSGWSVYRADLKSIEAEFRHDVEARARALERELALGTEVIHGVRGLFDASDDVRLDEFRLTASSILQRHPDIIALEWVPRISAQQRSDFEREGQALYGDFELTQLSEDGLREQAGQRDHYYPVLFVEPMAANVATRGVDIGSDPLRLQAIERTRDLNQPTATQAINLLQRHNQGRGILIMLPVYDGVPASRESRQAKLQGLVVGVFGLAALFGEAIEGLEVELVTLRLLDGARANAEIYRTGSATQGRRVTHRVTLKSFEQQQWLLEGSVGTAYFNARQSLLPWMVFGLGLGLVVAGSGYGILLMRRSQLVELQVELRTRELTEAKAELERLTRVDGLTGIANRRAFDERFEREWHRAQRDGKPLALLMIDVDHFKDYNDLYGHPAGDACLQAIAQALAARIQRASDFVGRYGGEEFAVIVPGTNTPEVIAEQLRAQVEALQLVHAQGVNGRVSISIGCCAVVPDGRCHPDKLKQQADKALYRAKAGGRNRCFGEGVTSALAL